MIIWFIITACVCTAEIFKSPKLDYRLISLGALLPLASLLNPIFFVLHTLLFSAVFLTVVMLSTVNKRLLRRRLLGLPIGVMFHLVFGGAWIYQQTFWWPIFGVDFATNLIGWHNIQLRLLLEILGIATAVWAFKRYKLDDKNNLKLLINAGHLNREVV